MATAHIEVKIANRGRKPKGGKMTAKQIKYFGTKRQRAALKAKRSNSAKKAKARHRPRTKPNRAPKKHRTQKNASAAPKKKRKRSTGSAKKNKKKSRKKNTGALYALVNPAGKGHKKMAKAKPQRKRPAGSHKNKRNKGRPRKHNAGAIGRPIDWLALGGGAIVGGLGATSLPQMVLGASNTGPVGYLAMAASTAILATVGHMVFKGKPMLTAGIIAGGAGALIRRILTDYTPIGQYLGASGLGDYLANWNFSTPQIIGGPGNTQLGAAGTTPVNVAGAGNFTRALAGV